MNGEGGNPVCDKKARETLFDVRRGRKSSLMEWRRKKPSLGWGRKPCLMDGEGGNPV
jgi:hypothetical protein